METSARQQISDEVWMRRALELACESVGLASPNPAVGCVLVKDGEVVGEGFHSYDRRDHAEVVALKAAGSAAKNSTAYVTLEPCSYTGRTGPCANALIEAGVSHVVVATGDPNPEVQGRGLERIRAAGIDVSVGLMSDEARDLNDGFARYIQTRLPFVTLKAGLSLDGCIAPASDGREPRMAVMLTGSESHEEVQRMRHTSDALITGIGTVMADDPLLTDRSGLPRRRPLVRVLLDSKLRLPLDSRLVKTANDDLIVFATEPEAERRRALEALHIHVEQIESEPGSQRVSIKRVLERLGEMQITSALIEAGSRLNAAALRHADMLALFYAPVFLGSDAIPVLESTDSTRVLPVRTTVAQLGTDALIKVRLCNPWAAVRS